jgi:signal transduction histidine kinase
VDLSETLKALISRQDSNKKITQDIKNNAMVIANRTFLEVAINNIIKNAVEAAKSEVRVSLKDRSQRTEDRRQIEIEIEDDGAGINDDLKDKIFEPFVTTKTNGTGLGLAIAYRIITGFGGNIIIDRSSLGGAKFTIVFPTKAME